jgi:hypothetical protein
MATPRPAAATAGGVRHAAAADAPGRGAQRHAATAAAACLLSARWAELAWRSSSSGRIAIFVSYDRMILSASDIGSARDARRLWMDVHRTDALVSSQSRLAPSDAVSLVRSLTT